MEKVYEQSKVIVKQICQNLLQDNHAFPATDIAQQSLKSFIRSFPILMLAYALRNLCPLIETKTCCPDGLGSCQRLEVGVDVLSTSTLTTTMEMFQRASSLFALHGRGNVDLEWLVC